MKNLIFRLMFAGHAYNDQNLSSLANCKGLRSASFLCKISKEADLKSLACWDDFYDI